MRRTLEMTVIEGIKTSIPLHLKILAEPDFIAGRLSTSFMERYLAEKKATNAAVSPRPCSCSTRLPNGSIPSSTPMSAAIAASSRDRWRWRASHGGARLLQLRVKSGSSARFLDLADGDRRRGRDVRGARSSSTIAPTSPRMARAAGVHVGQDDLPPDAVRQVARRRRHRPVDARRRSRSTRRLQRRRLHRRRTGLRHRHQGHRLHAPRSRAGAAMPPGAGKPVVAIGGITLEPARRGDRRRRRRRWRSSPTC